MAFTLALVIVAAFTAILLVSALRVGTVTTIGVPVAAIVTGPVHDVSNFAIRTRRLVDRLGHVERLRESRSVQPHDLISDFEARVLNLNSAPVVGP